MAIYLDNAATTRTRREVLDAMLPYFTEQFGNPSSLHDAGLKAKKALQEARAAIAGCLGCETNEIYFTSGGTEADNWAIKGYLCANGKKGQHIITSKIEHHAVLHTCRFLETQGFEVTYLDVDELGMVSLERLKQAIRPDTVLISIMYANNEIGTIQPIAEIGAIANEHGIVFHTDAVQAFGQLPISVKASGIDMLSASAHKLGGPKGVGLLYVRDGIRLEPLLHGGAQEKRMRSGTENVPGIIGFAKATVLAAEERREKTEVEEALRDYFIRRVLREVPYSRLNGSSRYRLPGNLNFSFQFVEASSLLVFLDMAGIHASSGSACTSASSEVSHVLAAIGLPEELARSSVRFTLNEETTKEEIDYTVEEIKKHVGRLRETSPYYQEFLRKQQRGERVQFPKR